MAVLVTDVLVGDHWSRNCFSYLEINRDSDLVDRR